MAYDRILAERVRDALGDAAAISEKAMFGGLCFLERGKLIAGVMGEDLLVRVGAGNRRAALTREGVREFSFGGRAMSGFVAVDGEVFRGEVAAEILAGWLEVARRFTGSLPAAQPSASVPPPE